jgi:hypothetical protein
MKRAVLKVREVMQFLNTGNPADLIVCSFDKRRPEKSGKRLHLKNVTMTSHEGFGKANVRLPNGDLQSFHPCLIEKYNGTRVTP